jgi:hypothetical protein
MSEQLDLILDAFLDEGPESAPAHLHAAVADEAALTQQLPDRWWRPQRGSGSWRSALAPVVVAVAITGLILVAGAGLLAIEGWLPGIIGGSQAASPNQPNAAQSPITSQATLSPAPTQRIDPQDADYSIGRHWIQVDGVRFAFDIDHRGWERYGNVHLSRSQFGPQGAEGIVYWTAYPNGQDVVACGAWQNNPPTSELATLMERIASAPGLQVLEAPSDTSLGGVAAMHISVRVTEDLGCDPGYLFSWKPKTGGALWEQTAIGDTLEVWAMKTQGRIFFVVAQTNANATDTLMTEMKRIVGSIGFEEPPA